MESGLSLNKPFEGLKVVELASVLAGPDVGMFFSELGAKVIKIENKRTGGDVTRKWKLPQEKKSSSVSAYFCSVNFKKEYLFLDFNNSDDYKKLTELIKNSDVVISNFKPGDDKKFKLDFEHIKRLQPTIIYAQLTGFGQNNPRVAYDLILQAETGFMSINGENNGKPLKMPVALIDVLAAHQLKEGVLTALYLQTKHKTALKVSVSLYDAAVASLKNQATNYLMAGVIPQAIGSLHPNIAPYGETFYTNDNKPVVLAIGSDKQFQELCKILGLNDLPESPYFKTNADRVKHRAKLAKILNEKIKTFNRKELLKKAEEKFIPIAPVLNIKEVFENPSAKKLVEEENIDGQPTKRVKTAVFNIEN